MPTKRLSMRKLSEVLRLKFEGGLSHAQIGRACKISKGAVTKYLQRAQAMGLSWPLPDGLDDAALERLLYPAKGERSRPSRYADPDFAAIHRGLMRKEVTLLLLWEEYRQAHPEESYSYAQFCVRYRDWRGRQKRSMRQIHKAGEKLFVDYCGPTVAVMDPSSGKQRKAQIFVAVLGASNYTYAEATWSQSLPDWIGSQDRALHYFQGVPTLIVPDNLRAGVTHACR